MTDTLAVDLSDPPAAYEWPRDAPGAPGGRGRRSAGATPSPAAFRHPVLRSIGLVLTGLGAVAALFVGYEFGATGLTHDRLQPALLAEFRQRIVTTTLDAPTAAATEGEPVNLLDLPRIGLSEVTVEGSSPEDLKGGPGHLRASPMPGEFGNSVIVGRRTTYGGPFGQLDLMQLGDPVTVTTGQGTFRYVVTSVQHLPAGQATQLGGATDSRLTLVTSDPAYFATGRLVVIAKLVGAPIAVASRPAAPVSSTDLGLAGEALWPAPAPAILWAVLAVAVVAITRRLRSRWPASVRYMLVAPVLIGLAVLCFSTLDLAFAGTL